MLIDASEVPNGAVVQSDLCIVGGGVLGGRVARDFTLASFGRLHDTRERRAPGRGRRYLE